MSTDDGSSARNTTQKSFKQRRSFGKTVRLASYSGPAKLFYNPQESQCAVLNLATDSGTVDFEGLDIRYTH